jgi:hypothetical protein
MCGENRGCVWISLITRDLLLGFSVCQREWFGVGAQPQSSAVQCRGATFVTDARRRRGKRLSLDLLLRENLVPTHFSRPRSSGAVSEIMVHLGEVSTLWEPAIMELTSCTGKARFPTHLLAEAPGLQVLNKRAARRKRSGVPLRAISLCRLLVCVTCTLMVVSPSFADKLRLRPAGVAALQGTGLVINASDGRDPFVQGQMIVPRDDADLPTLKFPRKYFLFRPLEKKGGGASLPEQRFEWAWVSSTELDFDTLDDLRAMFSNRDKQYGGWAKGFQALLAELDPQGALGLKHGDLPPVANPRIVRREGWFSDFLLHGRLPDEELVKKRREASSRPTEDPLGVSFYMPQFQYLDPEHAMGLLLVGIARAQKYGEPEPGFLAAALEAAHFLIETLHIPLSKAKGQDEEGVKRISEYVSRSRWNVLGFILQVDVDTIPPTPTSAFFQYREPDDQLPLNRLDKALAGVSILDAPLVNPLEHDHANGLVTALIGAAQLRRDILDPEARASLPPEQQMQLDAVGRRAFEVLLRSASVPAPGKPDLGAILRSEILAVVFGRHYTAPLKKIPSDAKAATAALLEAGIGSNSEAELDVYGLTRENGTLVNGPEPSEVAWQVQTLIGLLRAPKNLPYKPVLQRAIEERVTEIQNQRTTLDKWAPVFLELWRRAD